MAFQVRLYCVRVRVTCVYLLARRPPRSQQSLLPLLLLRRQKINNVADYFHRHPLIPTIAGSSWIFLDCGSPMRSLVIDRSSGRAYNLPSDTIPHPFWPPKVRNKEMRWYPVLFLHKCTIV